MAMTEVSQVEPGIVPINISKAETEGCIPAANSAKGVALVIADVVARHASGIGKEEESARHQGGVEEVHARAAENLLANDDGKGSGERKLPQRCGNRHNHRNKESRDQKAFVHFVVAYLGKGELDGQTDNI